jgi:DNA gyrase subunit A
MNITDKTGKLLSIQNVRDEDDLMIITKSGVTIRMHIDTIRTMGRAAQGVKLINLKNNAEIAAIANVPRTEDDEEDEILDALPIPENMDELAPLDELDDEGDGPEPDDMNTNDSEEELDDDDDE